MELPLEFTQKMKRLLGEDYREYMDSFNEPRRYGLRANPLKIEGTELQKKYEGALSPVPWCDGGFYFTEGERPAKHPYYHAGLYYLQEPSAMSPGAILPVQEGDRVLDVCAAPGGKATQLGARLNHTGLLVANDISTGRAKALLKNIELFGIRNSIVLSETPQKLAERFPNYFDKILIDAPCSGEGMFRKEPEMIKSWNDEMLAFCQEEQARILESCGNMLRPGGMMLYSTCTFAKEENEDSIAAFLEKNKEFSLVPIEKEHGFLPGEPPFTDCARLYPHKIKGEGHFLALLKKKGTAPPAHTPTEHGDEGKKELLPYLAFAAEVLKKPLTGKLKIFGDMLYLLPENMPSVKNLRVLRTGWQLGELKKGRFEPSQAFASGLKKEDVKQTVDFCLQDDRVIRYLKGETVEDSGEDGWILVCVEGNPLGWAKRQRGRLKNKYAVGWKWE